MTNPVYNQNGFRYYEDDGSWTVLENENVNRTHQADVNLILRFEVEVTNAKSVNNDTFTLYAQKNATGGYNPVTTTSTNGVQIAASANFADEDLDNNNRLTSSSLTFTGGILQEENTIGDNGDIDFVGQDHWEIGICITIDSANAGVGDFFDFEIRHGDGTALDGYTREPRLTRAGADSSDNQAAYTKGRDSASDNQAAYAKGSINTSDNQAAYAKGRADTSDSQAAYAKGRADTSDSQAAYAKGRADTSDSQAAYAKGRADASSNQAAYAKGRADASSNQAAYAKGRADVSSSQAAFVRPLTYLPFTEPWTGSDTDPWRISHWVTEISP